MSPPVSPPLHFRSPGGPLTAVLAEGLKADHFHASWLLYFGAVYMDKVRQFQEASTQKGALLRVHVTPRRFPVYFDFTRCVHAEEDDFVIVNKPAGLPTHPTCDNAVENLLFQMKRALGRDLYVTQRLDIATSGLLLFAKTKEFQRRFNRMLENRQIQKTYRAEVEGEIEPGTYIHYMKPTSGGLRVLSHEPIENWKRCSLEVLTSRRGKLEVALHTGRMHQIRAQLSFLGAPIVGDTSYGSGSSLDGVERIALQSCRLRFTTDERSFEFTLPG